jgi:hypothetical protein
MSEMRESYGSVVAVEDALNDARVTFPMVALRSRGGDSNPWPAHYEVPDTKRCARRGVAGRDAMPVERMTGGYPLKRSRLYPVGVEGDGSRGTPTAGCRARTDEEVRGGCSASADGDDLWQSRDERAMYLSRSGSVQVYVFSRDFLSPSAQASLSD